MMQSQNPESRIQNSEFGIRKPECGIQSLQPEPARQPARTFEDLIVWQKAHQFVLSTYRLTENFPRKELYGLTSQLRRAAVSIPANIAEGFKKRGKADKARYLNIAQGSLEECRYYLILGNDLNFGDTLPLQTQLAEVSKLLEGYTRAILNSGF